MNKWYLIFCALTCWTLNSSGQLRVSLVDSLKTILVGSWTAVENNCAKTPSLAIKREIKFTGDRFVMKELKEGIEVDKCEGSYKIDSVIKRGYRMVITLNQVFITEKVNSFILNLTPLKQDRMFVSWYEVLYLKEEQNYRHHIGDYRFYKDK